MAAQLIDSPARVSQREVGIKRNGPLELAVGRGVLDILETVLGAMKLELAAQEMIVGF